MQPVTLLDLDGCIVDSSRPILLSLNRALGEVGLEPLVSADLAASSGRRWPRRCR